MNKFSLFLQLVYYIVNFSQDIITEGKYPSVSLNSLQKPKDLEVFKTAVRNLLA